MKFEGVNFKIKHFLNLDSWWYSYYITHSSLPSFHSNNKPKYKNNTNKITDRIDINPKEKIKAKGKNKSKIISKSNNRKIKVKKK